jgi:hypothetical protein
MSLLYELAVQEDLNVGTGTVDVTTPDGGTLTGTQVGIHSVAVGQTAYTADWNPAAITAGSYEAVSLAVPGAEVGDFVMVSLASILTADFQITAHVSAADTVQVVLFNPTGVSVNLSEGTLSVLVFKARS